MDSGEEPSLAGRLTDHISVGVLARVIPRDAVDEVLTETGRREKRVRLLPAHVVVYFVVALAVFRDGYEEVLRRLVGGLRFMAVWRDEWTVPSTSALSQARERLGEEPLKLLFERVAVPLAELGTAGAWLRSWRLMAIDGVNIDVPDTAENLTAFEKARGGTRRPFPQIRSVGLVECGTHAVLAATTGSMRDGERDLATGLLGSVEPDMLITADRGFFSFELWAEFMVTGAALLWRVSAHMKLPAESLLPDGSYLSTIKSKKNRGSSWRMPLAAVADPRDASHIPVRVIEYTVDTGDGGSSETFRLVTTILDPAEATALELAATYQQRWEYELSLKEIETQLLAPGAGLRSKSPAMVRQEFWGLLLAHYAIRALMVEAADSGGIDPDRLSFQRTLNIVRRQVTDQAAFSPLDTRQGGREDDRRNS
ncbi:IS4 family transposase [Frankia torreyi]|uniref:IS4 family transposase n=4 Tax=Frankia TaxID=1854 RepID=UPI0005D0EC9F|nr:IS4 family transposase [Frankia torreyi]